MRWRLSIRCWSFIHWRRARLPPGLSRTGRDGGGLGGLLFHASLLRRFWRQFFFDFRFFLGCRRVAKMNGRPAAAGTFAGAETFDSPDGGDVGFRWHHFAFVAFPLGLNLVAIVPGAIDALGGELRGRHGRIFGEVAFFLQERVDLVFDLLFFFGVQNFLGYQELFVERDRIARFPIGAHVFGYVLGGIMLRVAQATEALGFDEDGTFAG